MHYRLYGLHPETGSIMSGDDLSAESDAEAIAKGEAVLAGRRFELWCGQRRVHPLRDAPLAAESAVDRAGC